MRLTLRTLLAYLDEILDPQDAEQLREKIEDSEFATALVHQIRGSVRRLRLDAPAVDAQGIGGDVNTVAEYLDNTLPPEHVPTFEKVCLENEVHLGEVASSHQILTLVLGQAADVTEEMRQRCYGIAPTAPQTPTPPVQPVATVGTIPPPPSAPPTQSDQTATTTKRNEVDDEPATKPAAVSPAEKHSARQNFTVPEDSPSTKETWRAEAKTQRFEASSTPAARPDYLQPHRSSLLRSLMVSAVVAFLIVAALLLAAGPFDRHHIVANWFGTDAPTSVPESANVDPENQGQTPTTDSIELEQVHSTERPSRWSDEQDGAGFDPNDFSEPAQSQAPLPSPPPNGGEPILVDPSGDPADMADIDPTAQQPLTLTENQLDHSFDPLPPESLDAAALPADGNIDRNTTTQVEPNMDLENSIPDVVDVAPTFPIKETDEPLYIEPAADGQAEGLAPRDDVNLADARTVNDTTTVDPGLDILPDPIEPPAIAPTATPLPNTGEQVETTDLVSHESAHDPSHVDPSDSPSVAPTKLVRADDLVLVFDRQTEDWQRVEASVPLATGDVLLGMPAFRADLEIASSVSCTMVGAVRLQLGPESDLTLDAGRLLLDLEESSRWQGIWFRGKRIEVSTPGTEGVVAVDGSRVFVPGSDPEQEQPHTVLKVLAIRNDVVIRYDGQTVDIPRGQQWIQLDDYEPMVETTVEKPRWPSASSRSRADVNAVRYWRRDIENVENIRIWLQERANNRRYNERALAARCLAEMDQFDAIVAALNDGEQHPFWDEHFETLQRALTRGPETATNIRFELEKVHAEDAAQLFEMLRGYNEQQLAEGAANLLVDNLDHPMLDHRVLAFQNLWRITGFTQAFNPEKPVGLRRRPVASWRGKLKSGRITYTKPPEIVALLESFAAPDQ